MTDPLGLTVGPNGWQTSHDYKQQNLTLSVAKFHEVNNLLLENPNFNSTHLFRADIHYDSAGILRTTAEKEKACCYAHEHPEPIDNDQRQINGSTAWPWPDFSDFKIERTVIRRLIPRNPQVDKLLDQTCSIGCLENGRQAVIYVPHITHESEMPWYHPPIRALAYVFEPMPASQISEDDSPHMQSALSIYFVPFADQIDPIPTRLHRTFLSLLHTFVRLAQHPEHPPTAQGNEAGKDSLGVATTPSALKDTILPQHIVQDTYTRLKMKYASDLIHRWVEKTEPSKHVFEDLSIAAFLIGLWKQMYSRSTFPGFVDIACGNGVLVYILLKEGYQGRGFDARRRKTWEILEVEDCLEEKICVPKPFLEAFGEPIENLLPDTEVNDGIFAPGTFIISNHADELTPWTPILAALSAPENPLPFLAIPCCSHSLSGAKHRYSPKDVNRPATTTLNGTDEQSAAGDLKALRKAKTKAAAHHPDAKSSYACLTKKVVSIAEEVGYEVELTLMRIPSTRNIGIVGNRKKIIADAPKTGESSHFQRTGSEVVVAASDICQHVIERECRILGGVQASARAWVEHAQKLQTGKGRGKVNFGGKLSEQSQRS